MFYITQKYKMLYKTFSLKFIRNSSSPKPWNFPQTTAQFFPNQKTHKKNVIQKKWKNQKKWKKEDKKTKKKKTLFPKNTKKIIQIKKEMNFWEFGDKISLFIIQSKFFLLIN